MSCSLSFHSFALPFTTMKACIDSLVTRTHRHRMMIIACLLMITLTLTLLMINKQGANHENTGQNMPSVCVVQSCHNGHDLVTIFQLIDLNEYRAEQTMAVVVCIQNQTPTQLSITPSLHQPKQGHSTHSYLKDCDFLAPNHNNNRHTKGGNNSGWQYQFFLWNIQTEE